MSTDSERLMHRMSPCIEQSQVIAAVDRVRSVTASITEVQVTFCLKVNA